MVVNLKTLVYDPTKGHDVLTTFGTLDLDMSSFATPQEAADAVFEALDTFATAAGYSEGSVGLLEPEEAEKCGYGRNWMVTWEDGPYEWAISASYQIAGPWGYTEPYHSFDLCFVER